MPIQLKAAMNTACYWLLHQSFMRTLYDALKLLIHLNLGKSFHLHLWASIRDSIIEPNIPLPL